MLWCILAISTILRSAVGISPDPGFPNITACFNNIYHLDLSRKCVRTLKYSLNASDAGTLFRNLLFERGNDVFEGVAYHTMFIKGEPEERWCQRKKVFNTLTSVFDDLDVMMFAVHGYKRTLHIDTDVTDFWKTYKEARLVRDVFRHWFQYEFASNHYWLPKNYKTLPWYKKTNELCTNYNSTGALSVLKKSFVLDELLDTNDVVANARKLLVMYTTILVDTQIVKAVCWGVLHSYSQWGKGSEYQDAKNFKTYLNLLKDKFLQESSNQPNVTYSVPVKLKAPRKGIRTLSSGQADESSEKQTLFRGLDGLEIVYLDARYQYWVFFHKLNTTNMPNFERAFAIVDTFRLWTRSHDENVLKEAQLICANYEKVPSLSSALHQNDLTGDDQRRCGYIMFKRHTFVLMQAGEALCKQINSSVGSPPSYNFTLHQYPIKYIDNAFEKQMENCSKDAGKTFQDTDGDLIRVGEVSKDNDHDSLVDNVSEGGDHDSSQVEGVSKRADQGSIGLNDIRKRSNRNFNEADGVSTENASNTCFCPCKCQTVN